MYQDWQYPKQKQIEEVQYVEKQKNNIVQQSQVYISQQQYQKIQAQKKHKQVQHRPYDKLQQKPKQYISSYKYQSKNTPFTKQKKYQTEHYRQNWVYNKKKYIQKQQKNEQKVVKMVQNKSQKHVERIQLQIPNSWEITNNNQNIRSPQLYITIFHTKIILNFSNILLLSKHILVLPFQSINNLIFPTNILSTHNPQIIPRIQNKKSIWQTNQNAVFSMKSPKLYKGYIFAKINQLQKTIINIFRQFLSISQPNIDTIVFPFMSNSTKYDEISQIMINSIFNFMEQKKRDRIKQIWICSNKIDEFLALAKCFRRKIDNFMKKNQIQILQNDIFQ